MITRKVAASNGRTEEKRKPEFLFNAELEPEN
jgi:hypothetical protein